MHMRRAHEIRTTYAHHPAGCLLYCCCVAAGCWLLAAYMFECTSSTVPARGVGRAPPLVYNVPAAAALYKKQNNKITVFYIVRWQQAAVFKKDQRLLVVWIVSDSLDDLSHLTPHTHKKQLQELENTHTHRATHTKKGGTW